MGSIRMIVACGAETRIAKKYAKFVEESRAHAQYTGPLVAMQFALIVRSESPCFDLYHSLTLNSVLWRFCGIRPCILVWHQDMARRTDQ
jgi:hypothetical protein